MATAMLSALCCYSELAEILVSPVEFLSDAPAKFVQTPPANQIPLFVFGGRRRSARRRSLATAPSWSAFMSHRPGSVIQAPVL
jgi:hypothetical protein